MDAIDRERYDAVPYEGFIDRSYFNANGKGIAIVAVKGGIDDWAAYIGADDGWSEDGCYEWTRHRGVKLTREQATRWFPRLPAEAYRD